MGANSTKLHKSFSLIELMVVIAIMMLLLTLLVSSAKTISEKAGALQCVGNGRFIIQGTSLFAEDNDGVYPKSINDGTGMFFEQVPKALREGLTTRSSHIGYDDQIASYWNVELSTDQIMGYHYRNTPQLEKMAEILQCPSSLNKDWNTAFRSYGIHRLENSSRHGNPYDVFGSNSFRGISSAWFSHYRIPSYNFTGYNLKESELPNPAATIAFGEFQDTGNMIGSPYDSLHLGYYGQILGPNGLRHLRDGIPFDEIWTHGFGMTTLMFADGRTEHMNLSDTVEPGFDLWNNLRFKREKDNYLWDSWPGYE